MRGGLPNKGRPAQPVWNAATAKQRWLEIRSILDQIPKSRDGLHVGQGLPTQFVGCTNCGTRIRSFHF